MHEERHFDPPEDLAEQRQRQGRRLRRGRPGPAGVLGQAGRAAHLGRAVHRGARLEQPAVRQVVRRRQAQRGVQLRRPARRGRQRRQGRVPLGRRARGRHPRHHLRRAQGRGLPGGERAGRARRQGRRPGRDLHADDPRDRRRDAGLRPASAPRTPWSSAGSPRRPCVDRIQDCDARVVITADGGYRRGAAAAVSSRPSTRRSRSCPDVRNVLVVKRTGQDVGVDRGPRRVVARRRRQGRAPSTPRRPSTPSTRST